ncbi:MAG: NtrZ family periplasmic regulatory protein [Brevundimonas sp.]|uniref:NtrZ family periplasmic regulatory protein n=1 Tax=Brevundimonas sp. TaxID=1871086 RepID=UPI00391AD824
MRLAGWICAVAVVGLTAGAAAAQTSVQTPATSGRDSERPALSLAEAQRSAPQRRVLQFREGGRWSLDLGVSQPVGRDTDWGDVEAGAYYRVNPRLRLGASAGLGRAEPDPARAAESDRRGQPRVRLESIFRF